MGQSKAAPLGKSEGQHFCTQPCSSRASPWLNISCPRGNTGETSSPSSYQWGKTPTDLYGQGSLQTRGLTGRNLRISFKKKGIKPGRWGDFLIAFFGKVFLFFLWFNVLVLISNFCAALADEFWGKMRILFLGNKSLRYQNVLSKNVCTVFF